MEKGQTRKLSYDELESDEKLLLKWYRENPLSVYIEIALIALEELEVITKNEYRKFYGFDCKRCGQVCCF